MHSCFVVISRLYYNFLPAFLFHITADIIFSAFLFASCFLHSRSESIVCTQYYERENFFIQIFIPFFYTCQSNHKTSTIQQRWCELEISSAELFFLLLFSLAALFILNFNSVSTPFIYFVLLMQLIQLGCDEVCL